MAGGGIDAFYTGMLGAYAYFPMLATQAVRGSDHMAEKKRKRRIKKFPHLVTRTSLGEFLLAHMMRPAEMLVVTMAAVMGTTEWLRGRPGPFGRKPD